ncbi:hypothetical protein VPHK406_0020 [Vibrio phage K406]
MKTEKFTELTVGYYKLIDKGGWLGAHTANKMLYSNFEPDDLIFIDEVIGGVGFNDEVTELSGRYMIDTDEYHFFEKVIPEPRTREDVEVTYSDRIRVGMGKHFHDYLIVAEIEDQYYVVQYNEGELPDGKSILEPKPHHNFTKNKVSWVVSCNIQASIKGYKNFNHNHVNAFSFLVGHCKGLGTDLYELGIFEL